MILLIHNNNQIYKVLDTNSNSVISFTSNSLTSLFFELAERFPHKKIIWCHKLLVTYINYVAIENISEASIKMISYESSTTNFINTSIGFVEQSLFVNINKSVKFPTWLMSSDVGLIQGKTLLLFKGLQKFKMSFQALLNYIAKIGIPKGLLCYSDPIFLKGNFPFVLKKQISEPEIFQFIKSNYKYRWVWLYQLNQLLYNKKIVFVSFFKSNFKPKVSILVNIPNLNVKRIEEKASISIDVLIPTLGREKYLKNVLLDLSKQTLKPTRVIIIEQQAVENSPSSLDFLDENWPFEIDHTLIHQLGVCNARNLALNKVSSDWVFFADDDICLNTDFLERSFKYIKAYKSKAVTLSCLLKGEKERINRIIQWSSFGSGCSIVNKKFLMSVKFDSALEFGYGEDSDFGMQLRNNGVDILYLPFVKMIHLKAPIGGFRKKIKKDWETEVIQPKPSPTVMLSKLKHATKEQLQGYKTNLFIKFYRNQTIKNPNKYFKVMRIAWDNSEFWARKLMKKKINEV